MVNPCESFMHIRVRLQDTTSDHVIWALEAIAIA